MERSWRRRGLQGGCLQGTRTVAFLRHRNGRHGAEGVCEEYMRTQTAGAVATARCVCVAYKRMHTPAGAAVGRAPPRCVCVCARACVCAEYSGGAGTTGRRGEAWHSLRASRWICSASSRVGAIT